MPKLTVTDEVIRPFRATDHCREQFRVDLEIDLPDDTGVEQLRDRIREALDVLRQGTQPLHDAGNVAREPASSAPSDSRSSSGPGRGNRSRESRGRSGASPKATSKQIRYVTDLAVGRGMTLEELNALAAQEFEVDDVNGLTRKQASELIDRFSGDSAAATGGRRAA